MGKPQLRLAALLYHHIGPLPPATEHPELTIPPEQFERQVQWLARRGYVGIRPSGWLAHCREGAALPPKPVLLTFDDGYADLAEHALPVLRRYGFSAAVLVVTELLGESSSWYDVNVSSRRRLLTKAQIQKWADWGIEFGAHTRTHPDLTALNNGDLVREIAGSKDDLKAILETPVVSFAYPYGRYNAAVAECVRQVFDLAFTVAEGLNEEQTDPCLLRRTQVQPGDSMLDLACRVGWGWSPLYRLRARVVQNVRGNRKTVG